MAKKKASSKPKNKRNKYSAKSKSIVTNIYTYSSKRPKRYGKTCIHFDTEKLTCKLTKALCKDADVCTSYVTNLKELQSKNQIKTFKHDKNIVGITTIILSDNRKCTNCNHNIDDLDAIIRIARPDGRVLSYTIPAAYCKECDTYFVLKQDYKIAKAKGVILCPIIDMTKQGESKNKRKNLLSSESRIHQLGYNVQHNNGYTKEQRQLILANIIENTNISIYEVESCIIRPMTQHKTQPNYADAVLSWQEDLEFIKNYRQNNFPKAIIDKIIIGRRK